MAELSRNFEDDVRDEILLYLAVAANDCYSFDKEAEIFEGSKVRVGQLLTLLDRQVEKFGSGNEIQYGLYRINSEIKDLGGRTILAFRGTDILAGPNGLIQDAGIGLKGKVPINPFTMMPTNRNAIDKAVDEAIKVTKKLANEFDGVHFICGHSLGGAITEVVCTATGLPGASFNCPGMFSPLESGDLLRGKEHENVAFECHLTKGDIFSLVGSFEDAKQLKKGASHIGKPIWYDGMAHSMDTMVENIHKKHPIPKQKQGNSSDSNFNYRQLLGQVMAPSKLNKDAEIYDELQDGKEPEFFNNKFSGANSTDASNYAQGGQLMTEKEQRAHRKKMEAIGKFTIKEGMSSNPLYDEKEVEQHQPDIDGMTINPIFGKDKKNPLYQYTGKSKGQSQSIKLNDNRMTTKKYERALRNRKMVNEEFWDYDEDEDDYNNFNHIGRTHMNYYDSQRNTSNTQRGVNRRYVKNTNDCRRGNNAFYHRRRTPTSNTVRGVRMINSIQNRIRNEELNSTGHGRELDEEFWC